MPKLIDLYKALQGDLEKMGPTPNAPYIPPSVAASNEKQIEDMKKFMQKDVTELAAGIKEPFAYDIVFVRGRRMIIPKAHAARMINATLFSCLYALEDSRIDKILAAVNAQAHFLTPEGEVLIQPIILADVPAPYIPAPKEVSVNPKEIEPPRHIFLDEEPKAFGQKAGQMVAMYDEKGNISSVGTIWAYNTKQDPVSHIVKTFAGNQFEVAESLLQKIDSMEEFATFCSKVRQQ